MHIGNNLRFFFLLFTVFYQQDIWKFSVVCLSLALTLLTTKNNQLMNQELSMNANLVVASLQKPASEFTKADIIGFIRQNGIRMVNFMYPAGDGRLKTLNFVITNEAYLEAILTCGERVDGSSLFSLLRQVVVICMSFRVSVRLLSIRLPKFPPFPCFVHSLIRMANRWRVHPNIRFVRLVVPLPMLQEWNFKRWASWSIMW